MRVRTTLKLNTQLKYCIIHSWLLSPENSTHFVVVVSSYSISHHKFCTVKKCVSFYTLSREKPCQISTQSQDLGHGHNLSLPIRPGQSGSLCKWSKVPKWDSKMTRYSLPFDVKQTTEEEEKENFFSFFLFLLFFFFSALNRLE